MVPGNDLGLERLGSNNAIIKVDNQRATSDLGVVLVVGMGEVSELGIGLLMSADNVKGEREDVVISIIRCEETSSSIRLSSLGDHLAKGWQLRKSATTFLVPGK